MLKKIFKPTLKFITKYLFCQMALPSGCCCHLKVSDLYSLSLVAQRGIFWRPA